MRSALGAFVLSALVSATLTPLIRRWAVRRRAADRDPSPSEGLQAGDVERASGDAPIPIPRLGGLAIVIGFYAPLLGFMVFETEVGSIFYSHHIAAFALMASGLGMAFLGVFDDLRGANAWQKLLVQTILAAFLYEAGFRIDKISLPFGGLVDLGVLGLPFTVLWIVGVVNAMNLIDGLDGLAAGVALIAVGFTFAVAVWRGDAMLVMLMASLGGGVLGFLIYNVNPASIYMGDTGSMFLGLVLATVSIQCHQKSATAIAIGVPIVVLGLPIADTLLAICRRIADGRSIFSADRDHLHHRLLAVGFTHKQSVLILYGVNILFVLVAVLILAASPVEGGALFVGLTVAFVWLVHRLGVVVWWGRQVDPGRRPRVLFINRSYWPDVEATGQLLTELCEDLARDFDVHVVCGQPHRVADGSEFQAGGSCERRGVTIHRVRHSRFDKGSFWGRAHNMASFHAAAVWRALHVPRPDVTVVETDPPLLCLLGRMLSRVRGCPLVCYLQDIYPDVAVALGKLRPGPLARILRKMFFGTYRESEAVVVLSRDMRALLLDGGVAAHRLHVIPNWVDTTAVYPVKENNPFRRTHGLEGMFVAMYSGNIGQSQRLELALDAADRLRDRSDIVFVMVGDGAELKTLSRLAGEMALPNVRFIDYQPKSGLAASLSAADVHLVVLQPQIQQLMMPSKLYGVLASGTPTIVLGDPHCELARIVTEHDLGAVAASVCGAALAASILSARTSPAVLRRQGHNARAFAEANCDRARSVTQFRTLLTGLLPTPRETLAFPTLSPDRHSC